MSPDEVVDLEAQVQAQARKADRERAKEAKTRMAMDQARDMQERGILQEMRGDVHDEVKDVYVPSFIRSVIHTHTLVPARSCV